MSQTIEARLESLGYKLPKVGKPVANFLPCVQTGNLLFVSGQVPQDEGGAFIAGRVGVDTSVKEAKELALQLGLRLIAVVNMVNTSLDAVGRVVKINGYVNCDPGFGDQPAVINGCSDLMVEVFGERGKHARAAVGVASLPGNAPVEIEGIFELCKCG